MSATTLHKKTTTGKARGFLGAIAACMLLACEAPSDAEDERDTEPADASSSEASSPSGGPSPSTATSGTGEPETTTPTSSAEGTGAEGGESGDACGPCPVQGVVATACVDDSCVPAECEPGLHLCADGCCPWTAVEPPTDAFAIRTSALDSAGVLHVSATPATTDDDCIYARYSDAEGWAQEFVPGALDNCRVGLDREENPIIVHISADDELVVRRPNGWSTEVVALLADDPEPLELLGIVSGAGKAAIHVVGYGLDGSSFLRGSVRLYMQSDSGWGDGVRALGYGRPEWARTTDITFGADGLTHLTMTPTHTGQENECTRYYQIDGTEVELETELAPCHSTSRPTTVTLGLGGGPHVLFSDDLEDALIYSDSPDGSTWDPVAVHSDPNLDPGSFKSYLTFDRIGQPHIAYATAGDVLASAYAYRAGDAWILGELPPDIGAPIGFYATPDGGLMLVTPQGALR